MKWVILGKTIKTREDSTKRAPFVVTFHPKSMLDQLRRLKKSSLNIELEVKTVFTSTTMTSFCARKIRVYLVRAKLYPLEQTIGSTK